MAANVPTGHTLHALAPGRLLKVPSGHCTGPASELGQYWPGVATQVAPPMETSHATAPAALVVSPVAHAKHELAPAYGWKRPTGHGVQELAFGKSLYRPAGHACGVAVVEAQNCPGNAVHVLVDGTVHAAEPVAAVVVPDGQIEHATAPKDSAKVPTGHCVHAVDPNDAANVPTGHAWHAS